MRRRAKSRGQYWRKVIADEAARVKIGALLRDNGGVMCEGDPVEAYSHWDRAGMARRIHAVFANGWRCTMSLRKDGTYSLSQAIKLVSQKPEPREPVASDKLSPSEAIVLATLQAAEGKVLTPDDLLDAVGSDAYPEIVKVWVHHVRRKTGADIQSIHGRGYRLDPEAAA